MQLGSSCPVGWPGEASGYGCGVSSPRKAWAWGWGQPLPWARTRGDLSRFPLVAGSLSPKAQALCPSLSRDQLPPSKGRPGRAEHQPVGGRTSQAWRGLLPRAPDILCAHPHQPFWRFLRLPPAPPQQAWPIRKGGRNSQVWRGGSATVALLCLVLQAVLGCRPWSCCR